MNCKFNIVVIALSPLLRDAGSNLVRDIYKEINIKVNGSSYIKTKYDIYISAPFTMYFLFFSFMQNRNSPVGRHGREILHQLRELTKSDTSVGAFSEDIDPVSEFLNWDLNYFQLEGNFGLDTNHDSSNFTVPAYEVR